MCLSGWTIRRRRSAFSTSNSRNTTRRSKFVPGLRGCWILATRRETAFVADHVNDPAWAEPVRMCAEELREQRGDRATDLWNARVGAKLVEAALAVDLVFAGELARLCGGLGLGTRSGR